MINCSRFPAVLRTYVLWIAILSKKKEATLT